MINRWVFAASVVVLAVLLVHWDYSYQPGGMIPLAIVRDHHSPPEGWVDALIQREGGLPKMSTHLTHYGYGNGSKGNIGLAAADDDARPDVFPVAHWQVERINLSAPYSLLTAICEQDVLYSIEVDFRVEYADGDTALFRWETWRYGWKFGPLAVDRGGGPAGDLLYAPS